MKIQYLGTAAFEGIPALFCDCEVCTEAKKRGGRNVRTRTQAILDDCLLIDFPADTYTHYLKYNMPMCQINSCIITHSHSDHLYAADFEARKKGMSNIRHNNPLHIYGGEDTYKRTVETAERLSISEDDIKAVLVKPYEEFEADGYNITPINASHDPNSSPYIYMIEKDGKTLLYSNDTGMYREDAWEYFKGFKKHIDLVSLDCTMGGCENTYYGHFGFEECIEVRSKFLEMGICDESTRFILTHFSHNGGKHALYDELVVMAEKEGFEVAYDGMVVEF